MDHVIGGADFQGSIEQAIDDAMGRAKKDDRIVLSYASAEALLNELDATRESYQASDDRLLLLHVLSPNGEQLINPRAIACVAVIGNSATIAFLGGGVVQFDGLAWRLLFSHLKEHVVLEQVPIAPANKLVQT